MTIKTHSPPQAIRNLLDKALDCHSRARDGLLGETAHPFMWEYIQDQLKRMQVYVGQAHVIAECQRAALDGELGDEMPTDIAEMVRQLEGGR